MTADAVGKAIAAANGAPAQTAQVEMAQAQMRLGSGRPAVLAYPADLTPSEALSLVAGILQIADKVAAARQPRRIQPASVLPRSLRRS